MEERCTATLPNGARCRRHAALTDPESGRPVCRECYDPTLRRRLDAILARMEVIDRHWRSKFRASRRPGAVAADLDREWAALRAEMDALIGLWRGRRNG